MNAMRKTALGARLANLRGASMTEYIIVVALVAVFLVGAVGMYGETLKDIFVGSKTKMNEVKNKANRGARPGGGHVVVD